MDERRTIMLDSETAPPAERPSRGTPLWLQIVISLLILAVAALAWAYFYPGARDILAARNITLPGLPPASTETAATGAQQGAPGANQRTGAGAGGAPRQGGGGQGGFGGGRGGNRTAVVVTAPVTSAVINDKLTAIGEGTAANSVTVISSAAGTLARLAVQPGQKVAANDVIAELDSQSEQIAFDRAQLAANDAAAALQRANELRRSNSASQVQLNAAQLANDQAQLELRDADVTLQKRKITSPIAGTVGILQVTAGNLVNAQTPITTVEDASEILINFWVPERYASAITPGTEVNTEAVALPGQSFKGTVAAVDNRIDPASRTLQVQARIANPDGRIRPGMSFQVTMSFPGQTYAAVDPLAIQWSSDGAYVWKYVDGKVQQAMVKIVERNSGGVLVSGDVAVGDQVVTQGVLQLQAGQTVRLLDDPGAGGQGGAAAQNAPSSGGQTGPNQGNTPAAAGQDGGGAPGAAPANGQNAQPGERRRRNGGQGRNGQGSGEAPAAASAAGG